MSVGSCATIVYSFFMKNDKQFMQSLPLARNFLIYCNIYLLTYSMEESPSWEANWFCSQSRNSPHFMEPESSLPYSQVPATCHYPNCNI